MELVCVIMILGVLAIAARQVLIDFRYEARVAAMEKIATAIQSNMRATMDAYRVRGSGSSIDINGMTIPVFAPGALIRGRPALGGNPTGPGMFLLLGCGATAPAPYTYATCASLPGYVMYTGPDTLWISLPFYDPDYGMSLCNIDYLAHLDERTLLSLPAYDITGITDGRPWRSRRAFGLMAYYENSNNIDFGDGYIGWGCR